MPIIISETRIPCCEFCIDYVKIVRRHHGKGRNETCSIDFEATGTPNDFVVVVERNPHNNVIEVRRQCLSNLEQLKVFSQCRYPTEVER